MVTTVVTGTVVTVVTGAMVVGTVVDGAGGRTFGGRVSPVEPLVESPPSQRIGPVTVQVLEPSPAPVARTDAGDAKNATPKMAQARKFLVLISVYVLLFV